MVSLFFDGYKPKPKELPKRQIRINTIGSFDDKMKEVFFYSPKNRKYEFIGNSTISSPFLIKEYINSGDVKEDDNFLIGLPQISQNLYESILEVTKNLPNSCMYSTSCTHPNVLNNYVDVIEFFEKGKVREQSNKNLARLLKIPRISTNITRIRHNLELPVRCPNEHMDSIADPVQRRKKII